MAKKYPRLSQDVESLLLDRRQEFHTSTSIADLLRKRPEYKNIKPVNVAPSLSYLYQQHQVHGGVTVNLHREGECRLRLTKSSYPGKSNTKYRYMMTVHAVEHRDKLPIKKLSGETAVDNLLDSVAVLVEENKQLREGLERIGILINELLCGEAD